jgi:hypothetical protein
VGPKSAPKEVGWGQRVPGDETSTPAVDRGEEEESKKKKFGSPRYVTSFVCVETLSKLSTIGPFQTRI